MTFGDYLKRRRVVGAVLVWISIVPFITGALFGLATRREAPT